MSDQRVGILVEAIDKASAIFRRIGAAANTNLSLSAEGARKVSDNLRRLPEMASKSSMALMAINTASAKVGGAFAMAAQKATGLISLVGVGGPLGIGIAAVTVAIAAGAVVWDAYTLAEKNAGIAAKETGRLLSEQKQRVRDHEEEVRKLEKAVADFGKTSQQVTIEGMRAEVRQREYVMKSLQSERKAILNGRNLQSQENQERLKTLDIAVSVAEKKYELTERALNAEEQLQNAEKNKTVADEANAKREQNATSRKAEMLGKVQQELQLLQEQADAGKITATVYESQAQGLEQIAARLTKVAGISQQYANTVQSVLEVSEAARIDENELAEARAANLKKAQADLARYAENRAAQIDLTSELELARAKQVDAELTRDRERALALTQAIGQAAQTAAEQWAAGSISGGQAAKQATLGAARAAIMAASGEAAAKALAAHAGIPFVGTAIGLAIAGALTSMILGLLSRVPQAARGGEVRGGIPGRDSVIASLMPGEVVQSTPQVARIDRLATRLETMFNGGPQFALAGAGGRPVNLTIQSLTPATPLETARAAKVIRKTLGKA